MFFGIHLFKSTFLVVVNHLKKLLWIHISQSVLRILAQGRANLKRIRDGLHQCELAGRLAKRLGTLSPEHTLGPSPA